MRVSSEIRGEALLSDFSQFVWTHLGMKRSTLQQRICKLGIARRSA